jgi:hypothetical protein
MPINQSMAAEDEWGNIVKIDKMIDIPNNVTDTSLFCLPVQTTGADTFKLAL